MKPVSSLLASEGERAGELEVRWSRPVRVSDKERGTIVILKKTDASLEPAPNDLGRASSHHIKGNAYGYVIKLDRISPVD